MLAYVRKFTYLSRLAVISNFNELLRNRITQKQTSRIEPVRVSIRLVSYEWSGIVFIHMGRVQMLYSHVFASFDVFFSSGEHCITECNDSYTADVHQNDQNRLASQGYVREDTGCQSGCGQG